MSHGRSRVLLALSLALAANAAALAQAPAGKPNIVEGLGGTITVLSSMDPEGHGTEIRVDLPTLSKPSGSRASGAA